jgi:hypothetical protein
MITEDGFSCTAEDIHPPTPEDDAEYCTLGAHYAATARALLMTVRHLMTGREIDHCEIATGDFDDPDGFDMGTIDRLANQFPREIAAWVDGRVRA